MTNQDYFAILSSLFVGILLVIGIPPISGHRFRILQIPIRRLYGLAHWIMAIAIALDHGLLRYYQLRSKPRPLPLNEKAFPAIPRHSSSRAQRLETLPDPK